MALFDSAELKQLKSECGGLQTLMKNNKQLFVVKGGGVRLRKWGLTDTGMLNSVRITFII